jgi:hypothetical protein
MKCDDAKNKDEDDNVHKEKQVRIDEKDDVQR